MTNIVYEGTSKSGRKFIVRYPQMSDDKNLLNYINTISLEKTFITFQGEQLTLDEEEAYIQTSLKAIEDKSKVVLIAFHNDNIIGSAAIEMGKRIEKHVGNLGITIAYDYRNDGIGLKYLESLIAEAVKQLPTLKIIKLSVFGNNPTAIHLYESLGFIEYGNLPNGLAYQDKFVDHIYMYKKIV